MIKKAFIAEDYQGGISGESESTGEECEEATVAEATVEELETKGDANKDESAVNVNDDDDDADLEALSRTSVGRTESQAETI